MHDVDVAILGGGPTGRAAAAVLTRAGRSVVLVERDTFDERPPTGAIAHRERFLLARHGATEAIFADRWVPAGRRRAAWGDPTPAAVDPVGEDAAARRLAAIEAETAAAGNLLILRGYRPSSILPAWRAGWTIELRGGGTRSVLGAGFLIDASGRSAAIARRRGALRASDDALVAIVGLRGLATEREPDTLIEAAANGWWQSTVLPGGRLAAVAYLTDADLLPRTRALVESFWELRLEETVHTAARLLGSRSLGGLQCVGAESSRLAPVCGKRWLAAGEAAIAIDAGPQATGARALDDGWRAGQVVVAHLAGDHGAVPGWTAEVQRWADDRLGERTAIYAGETRWRANPFWRRRQPAGDFAPAIGDR